MTSIDSSAPKQFAYIDGSNTFHRSITPIDSREKMQSFIDKMSYKAAYESVYGFTRWVDGRPDPRSAVVDCIYLDFDDVDNPERAIRDAAEAAFELSHTTQYFSGKKGIGMLVYFRAVDLITDLKGAVIRRFVDELSTVLPDGNTLDYAVVGDLNRVHRCIDTRHLDTRLYAIGLREKELSELSIDEIREHAKSPRYLIQKPVLSDWVAARLREIEIEIIGERIDRIRDAKMISGNNADILLHNLRDPRTKSEVYEFTHTIEEEYQRIRRLHAPSTNGINGATKEEVWLKKVVAIFQEVGRANNIQPVGSSTSTSTSEHKARCHLVELANDCGWGFGEICDIFSCADDYDRMKTEQQVKSLIRRR